MRVCIFSPKAPVSGPSGMGDSGGVRQRTEFIDRGFQILHFADGFHGNQLVPGQGDSRGIVTAVFEAF